MSAWRALPLAYRLYSRRRLGILLVGGPLLFLSALEIVVASVDHTVRKQMSRSYTERILNLVTDGKASPFTRAEGEQVKKLPHVVNVGWSIPVPLNLTLKDGRTKSKVDAKGVNDGFLDRDAESMPISAEARAKWAAQKNGAIAGKAAADEMGWTEGQRLLLESKDGMKLDVVLVHIAQEGDPFLLRGLFLHDDYVASLSPAEPTLRMLWVIVDDVANVPAVVRSTEQQLQSSNRKITSATYFVIKQGTEAGSETAVAIFRIVGIVCAVVTALSLIAMLATSLDARRRNVATLRAIGATRGYIRWLTIIEALVLVVPPTVAGTVAILGFFWGEALNLGWVSTRDVKITPEIALAVAGGISLFTAALALLFGWRASAADVVTELRGA